MENIFTVIVIIVIVVYNLISNYMKEQRKSHERKRNAKPILSENFPPITPLFQKKKEETPKSNTTPVPESYEGRYNSPETIYYPYTSEDEGRIDYEQSARIDYNNLDSAKYPLASSMQSPFSEKNNSSTTFSVEDRINMSSKSEIDEQYEYEASQKHSRLNLNTPDDYKRAFVYSLIFDRKY